MRSINFDTKRKRVVVSISLGLLAIFCSILYLKGRERDLLFDGERVPVLVAKKDISPGKKLDSAILEVIKLPRRYRLPKTLTDLREIEGLVVMVPILKGEQVSLTKLSYLGREGGVSALVPVGMRAVSISIDDQGSLGLIKPGDFVDLLATFDVGVEGGSRKYTHTLLQGVNVLAVGGDVVENNEAGKKAAVQPFVAKASTNVITLAVSPADAQKVFLARESGGVHLTTRNRFDDGRIIEPRPETLFSMTKMDILLGPKEVQRFREYRGR